MKHCYLSLVISLLSLAAFAQEAPDTTKTQTEINKEIARNFYQDLWFTNHTDNYHKYVADEYVVHDIGEFKGVTEAGIQQKEIADLFWENGELDSKIDYQIAEGDLVATRWTLGFQPKTLFGRIALEPDAPIGIINVFRIKDGKIVELWNHRHDIDTPQTLAFTMKGFLIGLLFALIPLYWVFKYRRALRKMKNV